jgi:CheY-like chemotaxis protein
MVASIYYMRQICDALSANIQFERNITDENVLNVQIPVALSSGKNKVISVPILKNKNILVVSPYSSVLKNISEQLKVFGLNVTGLSDKYSAIGHIVGQNNDEKAYDLFIIDHNLPDIDAESLTKIIRENYRKNLTHIIIITTENHLSQIEQNKSMYDAVFTKPVMPQLLKEKLEEFIEIQLYGQTDSEYSEDGLESGANTIPNESNTHRFLAIMDEELSTMLLQLVLTKVNYHVDVALTATQLYEFIENNHYQFIFISNKCPWIVPENLSRDIRRHHSDNKDSVLIMIYDTLKDATHKKLVRAGYDDFIPLPLSRSIFMEKIQDWHDPIAKRMRPDLDSPIQEVNNELDETSLEHSNNFDDDIDTSQNESNG